MATQPNMTMTMAPAPAPSPLAKAADFDFQKEAGPMAGAAGWSPSENAMASNQLSKLLASDSKLMTQARSMAARSSARRGLLNSSIGVEAGESAAIQSAVPIATQDAGTHARAEEFSANAANQFAMEGNRFGRESALTKYQGILAREAQERDQGWRTSESALDRTQQLTMQDRDLGFRSGESALDRGLQLDMQGRDQGWRTGERVSQQDFQAAQSVLDRNQQLRVQELQERGMDTRQATQIAAQERDAAANRAFSSEQAGLDRTQQTNMQTQQQQFQAAQAGLDRQQQATLQANSQEWQAAQSKLNQQFQMDFEKFRLPMNMMAGFSDRMQGFVTQVMSDPNLTPEARNGAIQNYYNYSQQTMGWMANFFGQPMPNMATGGSINPTGQASVPAPVTPGQVGPTNPNPTPSPAPSPADALGGVPNVGIPGGGRSIFDQQAMNRL